MEERQDAVEDLGALVEDGDPRNRFFDVRHEVGVRERGGLRDASRAARVDEEGDVVHGGGAVALPGGGRAHGSRPGARPTGAWAGQLISLLPRGLDRKLEGQARGRGQSRRQVHREGGVAAAEEGELF